MSPNKETQKSGGFTAEERAAMKERAKELAAEERASKNRAAGRAICWRRSPRCRNRIAAWPAGCTRSSPRARRSSGRRPGTGCPRMPGTARSSASSRARRSSARVRDVWLPGHGAPGRRQHVADLVCAEGVDRRRRGQDRRTGEACGELRSHHVASGQGNIRSHASAIVV